jgi:hypothetical protein
MDSAKGYTLRICNAIVQNLKVEERQLEAKQDFLWFVLCRSECSNWSEPEIIKVR